MVENCGKCKFGNKITYNADDRFCSRFPPTPDSTRPDTYSNFPVVSPEAWCGEYKPIPAEIHDNTIFVTEEFFK